MIQSNASRSAGPRVSVVVPVHNGGETLALCLSPLTAVAGDRVEVIVVDDRSTDASAAIAASAGATVVPNPRGRGPAAARNVGAERARGAILFFVDADVIVESSAVDRLLALFDAEPAVAGVFGSYDDAPFATNFLSQYKNLFHHFTHQTSEADSGSFWGGCGAIRREVFEAVGGFDEVKYPRPSIEDIELGFRLRRAGYAVRLDHALQAKHLKRWTTVSLLKADIVDRAIPWSALIVSADAMPNDLNLRWPARVSAALVGVLAFAIPFLALGHRKFYAIPVSKVALAAALTALVHVIVLNREFYRFLGRTRGWLFTVRAVPMHLCYYFYSGVTFVVCWTWEQIARLIPARRRNRAASAAS